MSTDLAAFATQEFVRRKQIALRMLTSGQWTAAIYHNKLAPWLAIACDAGADLPELWEPLTVVYPYDREGEEVTRKLHPDDICPVETYRAALAEARNAAIEAHDKQPSPQRAEHARGLIALARHLRVGPQAAAGDRANKNPPPSTFVLSVERAGPQVGEAGRPTRNTRAQVAAGGSAERNAA